MPRPPGGIISPCEYIIIWLCVQRKDGFLSFLSLEIVDHWQKLSAWAWNDTTVFLFCPFHVGVEVGGSKLSWAWNWDGYLWVTLWKEGSYVGGRMLNFVSSEHHCNWYPSLEMLLEFRQVLVAKLPRRHFHIHPSLHMHNSAWLRAEAGILICIIFFTCYSCCLSPLPGLLSTICILLLLGNSTGKRGWKEYWREIC